MIFHYMNLNFHLNFVLIPRLILIWEERQIFNRKLIAVITSIWKNRGRSRERSSYTPPIPQQLSYGSPQAQSYASPSLKRPITPDTPPVPPAKRDNNGETVYFSDLNIIFNCFNPGLKAH